MGKTAAVVEIVQPNEVIEAKKDYDVLVGQLNAEERSIVLNLLNTDLSAREVVPDDIDKNELWRMLGATAKALSKINLAVSRLKPYLGRMLVVVQSYPDLYQAIGYETFSEFMTKGVWEYFSVSRSEAFAAKRVAEELADRLTPDQMTEIGFSKLAMAATAIRKKIDGGVTPEIREREIGEWISDAQTLTVVQLRERIASKGLIEEGDLEMDTLVLTLRKNVRDRFMEFRRQPWVKAHCGGESDSFIIDSLMQEAATWEAELIERNR